MDDETIVPAEPSPDVPAPAQPPPSRNWTPVLVVGLVLALAIIGLLAWLVLTSRGGSVGPLAETHTIAGTLSAPECSGGYAITSASVELRDQNDKLIGAATTSGDTGTGSGCLVTFTITDVPKASFYQVKIGSHDGPTYSYDEMKAFGWKLDLSLSG